jgi:hypothetical protein
MIFDFAGTSIETVAHRGQRVNRRIVLATFSKSPELLSE